MCALLLSELKSQESRYRVQYLAVFSLREVDGCFVFAQVARRRFSNA